MRPFIIFIGFVMFLIPLSPSASIEKWEKLSDIDGIEVFKKEISGSPIIAFKGQGILNASVSKVAQVIMDSQHATEWVDSLEETRRLKSNSPLEYINYSHIGTPFVIKDRDFVTHTKIEIDQPRKEVIFRIHSTHSADAPKTSYIRGDVMNSSYTLRSLENGQKTYIIGEIHADPKGDVPKWLVNLVQKNWPYKVIQALRKQVIRPEVSESAYIQFNQ